VQTILVFNDYSSAAVCFAETQRVFCAAGGDLEGATTHECQRLMFTSAIDVAALNCERMGFFPDACAMAALVI
jgi:hypothetical protein